MIEVLDWMDDGWTVRDYSTSSPPFNPGKRERACVILVRVVMPSITWHRNDVCNYKNTGTAPIIYILYNLAHNSTLAAITEFIRPKSPRRKN